MRTNGFVWKYCQCFFEHCICEILGVRRSCQCFTSFCFPRSPLVSCWYPLVCWLSGLVSQILDFVGFVGPAIVLANFITFFVGFVSPASVFELSKTCFVFFYWQGQQKWKFKEWKSQKLEVFGNRRFLLALPSFLHTTKVMVLQNRWPCQRIFKTEKQQPMSKTQ